MDNKKTVKNFLSTAAATILFVLFGISGHAQEQDSIMLKRIALITADFGLDDIEAKEVVNIIDEENARIAEATKEVMMEFFKKLAIISKDRDRRLQEVVSDEQLTKIRTMIQAYQIAIPPTIALQTK